MKKEPYEAIPARGLSMLMMHERPHYFCTPGQCQEYVNPWFTHPFDLDLPDPVSCLGRAQIDFVGARATDMSVEAFLVQIRQYAGYADGSRIIKLRVISMPARNRENYVFFEFWTSSRVVISGETTDFSGAGNSAREKLEDVFALLAHVYGLTIERVQLNRKVPIQNLYAVQSV